MNLHQYISTEFIWVILGKLPTLLALLWLFSVGVKRLGRRVALWSMAALCASLSLGVTLLPSILGAILSSIICYFSVVRALTRREQRGAERLMLWPFTVMFAVILCVGRVGCWAAGCCFGEVTSGWWGTQYAAHHLVAHYHIERYGALVGGLPHPVHPVQLYEAALVALSLGLASWSRRRVGEGRAALILASIYLVSRAALDPLRAAVNTLSSLTQWGPLSAFQWGCLGIACALLVIALRQRRESPKLGADFVDRSLESDHPLALLCGWIAIAFVGLLSVKVGTPFTAQLSALALCLAAVPLMSMLRARLNSLKASQAPMWAELRSAQPMTLMMTCLAIAVTPLITLAPLSAHLSAEEGSLTEDLSSASDQLDLSPRGWVYGLDPLSKKLGRIGRVDELDELNALDADKADLPKLSLGGAQRSDEPLPDQSISKQTPPRLRILLGGGAGQIKHSGGGGCGGESYLRSVRAAHVMGSYRIADGDWRQSLVGSARWISIKEEYEYYDDYLEGSAELTQLVLGFGYQLESRWLRLGLAPSLASTLEQRASGDMRDINAYMFGLDYRLGVGFAGSHWSLFLEAASGPGWGIGPTLGNRVMFDIGYQSSAGKRLSLKLSPIAASLITGIFSPGIEAGVEMPRWSLHLSAVGGPEGGAIYGLQVGLKR